MDLKNNYTINSQVIKKLKSEVKWWQKLKTRHKWCSPVKFTTWLNTSGTWAVSLFYTGTHTAVVTITWKNLAGSRNYSWKLIGGQILWSSSLLKFKPLLVYHLPKLRNEWFANIIARCIFGIQYVIYSMWYTVCGIRCVVKVYSTTK